MRTFKDTQIYKEWDGIIVNKPTKKEWEIIDNYISRPHGYKGCMDNANGFFAISLSEFNQENEDTTLAGGNLVDLLNEECITAEGKAKWYLGDIDEEYVFVN